jgi:hypothetical protein
MVLTVTGVYREELRPASEMSHHAARTSLGQAGLNEQPGGYLS